MGDDAEIVKAVAQGTVEGAFAPFGKLVTNLLGPITEEMGHSLRDRFLAYRTSRTKRLLGRVQEIFEEQQIEPQPVRPKLLAAVLENGSLEEDDSLQDRWAMLLVNSSARRGKDLLPSASEILKQLNPWEVMLLQRCYNALTMDSVYPYPHPESQSQRPVVSGWHNDLRFEHHFDQPSMGYSYDFAIMTDNLLRLGLLRRKEDNDGDADVVLTTIGYEFIELCQVEYKGPREYAPK